MATKAKTAKPDPSQAKVTVQSKYSNLAGVYLPKEDGKYMRSDGKTFLRKVEDQGWVFCKNLDSDTFFVKSDQNKKFPWQCKAGSYGEGIQSLKPLHHQDSSTFPKRLYVQSKYGNLDGGYTLLPDLHEEYPAYYNKEDGLSLWHSAVAGSWKITKNKPGNDFIYAFATSDSADPSTVDVKGFADGAISAIQKITYEEDADKDDGLYIDNKFPPAAATIGDPKIKDVEWIRATQLNRDGEEKLFHLVEPTDLLQGSVGDCWLIASIATLAEFPDCVKRLFVSGHEVSSEGKYAIQLYDVRSRDWTTLVIDDLIPCRPRGWWTKTAEPYFAKACGNELWAILLEKAFARFVGSYEALNGGHTVWAWQCLTGVERQIVIMKSEAGEWEHYEVDVNSQRIRMEGGERRACPLIRMTNDPVYDKDALFEYLASCDRKKYMMSSGISSKKAKPEYQRKDGLVEGHAYSVLSVVNASGQQLVQLRNPWGNEKEWKGKWSDNSAAWKQHPDVHDELKPEYKADGTFWMAFEDFVSIFSDVKVCPTDYSPLETAEKLPPTKTESEFQGFEFKPVRSQLVKAGPAGMMIDKLMGGCAVK